MKKSKINKKIALYFKKRRYNHPSTNIQENQKKIKDLDNACFWLHRLMSCHLKAIILYQKVY